MSLQILACGLLLLLTSLASPALARLPVSASMIYLAAGLLFGPLALGWIDVDIVRDASWVEVLAEGGVLVSLFVTGLKIDVRTPRRRWTVALRLATLTMVLTIAATTLLAYVVLDLPWALALVLGAILAPTDPVLAAEIQIRDHADRDALRFGLSGEAGLNDGTAFPFVLLGLGLLGLQGSGFHWVHWAWRDLLWSIFVDVAVGWAVGHAVGIAAIRFRGWQPRLEPLSEFVAVGSIAASFGAAQALGGYGFIAVFVTGLGLRRAIVPRPAAADDKVDSVLQFNGQLERMVEFVLVILVGVMLADVHWSPPVVLFALAMLFVLRPVAVALTVRVRDVGVRQRRLIGWFGIRGVGSVYYLAHAINQGIEGPQAAALASQVLAVVALSVLLHGVSVTPLMAWHERRKQRERPRVES